MNHPHIDENCGAYWVGRFAAIMTVALTALREKNVTYSRRLLVQELRAFDRSTLCDEALREILREL